MSYFVYLASMWFLWGLIGVLGGIVAAFCLLAWRRQRTRPLLFLSVGLLLLSVVPAVMWLALYTVTDDIYSTTMYCTGVMATGFLFFLGSVLSRSS